jgi:NAD(P)-dependent dehydrogenase (short-subunit alcohol dehydrogenase family)
MFTYSTKAAEAEALASELGDRVRAIHCDLSNHASLPTLIDTCVSAYGRIDVLVNNAGIFEENPFFDNDYDAWRRGWERTFAVNLFGTADLTYLALQHMRAQGGGKIINVTSRAAHRGELTNADYGASKAALVNLTKSIARSCGKYGVSAISIAPGFIETDMAAPDLDDPARRAELEAEVPLGYIGTAEEVGEVIAFFASERGNYANGSTIDLNGGSYVR